MGSGSLREKGKGGKILKVDPPLSSPIADLRSYSKPPLFGSWLAFSGKYSYKDEGCLKTINTKGSALIHIAFLFGPPDLW